MADFGLTDYFKTSAKEGTNTDLLRARLLAAIDWTKLPEVTSTALFAAVKQFVMAQTSSGTLLTPLDELRATDFVPFAALADLPMGMTAHVLYTAIDAKLPATLSPAVISLIRKEIGFDLSPAAADIAGSPQGVPILIRLSLANFSYFGDTKPDGSDFRVVADDDKTPLKFHFERYDPQNQMPFLWVAMPKLTGA